ncbi:DUF6174 domain-containing protein [Nocardioides sp. TF02-7]|uniref:DUF6174 domain-containing protein n=1 Tax=Nocardioides sp. TF02-7 TaxID=2917724 RepID=UPI001F0622F0|nr:DUF6174 domain-containing protein [Nocardioides sp. TF02-7]UMG91721.1 DUF6174 domain-containing protein [Nocardioides sp. TF02-7]
MKTLIGTGATLLALGLLAGCGGDDGGATADDPATADGGTTTTGPTDDPTTGTYPEFAAQDYTYLLEQVCFCPVTGPVQVTVRDGEVVEAVVTRNRHGVKKGTPAPDYLRATINDVIARANDTEADSVEVVWPEGQDYPSRVEVDQMANATDDEITFIVRDVRVDG